jgi:hypothetical protein
LFWNQLSFKLEIKLLPEWLPALFIKLPLKN